MLGNCCLNILLSLILGAIFGILIGIGTITITPLILFWIIFGISIGILALLLIGTFVGDERKVRRCICSKLPCLLLGTLGGIIFSVLPLVITGLGLVATAVFAFLATTAGLIAIFGVADVIRCGCPKICD